MDSGIGSLESEKLSRLESQFSNLLLQIYSELELRKQNKTGEFLAPETKNPTF